MRRLTLKEMQTIAGKRGGRCLSQEYINDQTKLLWECAEGHRWKAKAAHVKDGHWCPECGGTKKLTLQEMQMLARKHGGKCLSQEYQGVFAKLLWECREGHRWKARPNAIKQGQWCPVCKVKKLKLTLEEMQEIARKQGGKCLSQKYVNARTKLLWKCGEGHQWEAVPTSIKSGSWCPVCHAIRRANQRKLTARKRARGSAFSRSL